MPVTPPTSNTPNINMLLAKISPATRRAAVPVGIGVRKCLAVFEIPEGLWTARLILSDALLTSAQSELISVCLFSIMLYRTTQIYGKMAEREAQSIGF